MTGHDIARRVSVRWAVWLLALLACVGCDRDNAGQVHVSVGFAASAAPHRLTDVSAIAGGDRFFWHRIDSGALESVVLGAGRGNDTRLTLIYKLDDREHSWEGPAPADGRGYRIKVIIDAENRIAQTHCPLPCALE